MTILKNHLGISKADLFQLTKFEIVTLEIITLVIGFFIGQPLEHPVRINAFVLSSLGTLLIAAGAGAFNQIQEAEKDATMDRTKNRPLPSGRVSKKLALKIALFCVFSGGLLLSALSPTQLVLGLVAFFSYNVLYTLWWKPKHAFAAIPGAIPGAMPILMGYQAATQSAWSDPRGLYLFGILFFWQMPHFWVLALKYSDDYDKGGFPTLPTKLGHAVTRFQIVLWSLAYSGLGVLAPLFFPLGTIGIVGCVFTSAGLLIELRRFLVHPEKKTWLRFFLVVNFTMLLYIGFIAIDLWSILLYSRG